MKRKPKAGKHATVRAGEYTVPLIGIPPDAVMETCDLCGDEFGIANLELVGKQMLCAKCRT